MTTTTAEAALIAIAATVVLGCGPERVPGPAPASASPAEARDAGHGPALPPSEILAAFQTARRAAAGELVVIALLLPPGARDPEVSWILERADPPRRGQLIEALDPAEIARFSGRLRVCARSRDPAERDPAAGALAAAGDWDVQPLVARALRTERSESSLVILAEAAARLRPLLPAAALKTALARARTPRALLAITGALGESLDVEALQILGTKGSAGRPALEHAVARLRGNDVRPAPADPAAGPRACDPASSGHLRRAAEAIETADAERERAVTGWLAARLESRGPEAAASATALGTLGTPGAMRALAGALSTSGGSLLETVSAALASSLEVGPARVPQSARELRALWFPIIATLGAQN